MRAMVVIVAALLLATACRSTPKLPIAAQCNPLCSVKCTTDGIAWTADPASAEAWDELGGEVVPALVGRVQACEVSRSACEQCLNRLDAAGVITQGSKP
jgi:hypothetical protein